GFHFMTIFSDMLPNVSRLKRGCDSSGLSFLCQDKTFFVKTKFPVTENQQSRLAAVVCPLL
ncbi:hypothetical protein, partial [Flavobacterium noncentrifugens]|uniref:hypothetical protein n=1 Tax=Flavobacterium noncentrifugens TaxID=1128970 RepID=UPI001C3139D4